MPRDDLIRVRRGPAAAWAASTEILYDGEPAYAVDTGEIRIGDGFSTWSELTTIGNVDAAAVNSAVQDYLTTKPTLALQSAVTEKFAGAMGVVVHGSDASAARPTGYAQVTWIGSVTPTNATANDIWQYKA